jgi:transposase-like protein
MSRIEEGGASCWNWFYDDHVSANRRCATIGNDTIVSFSNPAFRKELSDLAREGTQRIIRQAVEAELMGFLEGHAVARDAEGRRAVVRNGRQPERQVLTGIGAVTVKVPNTRDRAGAGRCFRSTLLPPYLKKAKRREAVLPWLYLKGVPTNDFTTSRRRTGNICAQPTRLNRLFRPFAYGL